MEKPKCYQSSKHEFFVGLNSNKTVTLGFSFPHTGVTPTCLNFIISYKKWKNIIKFLRVTINRKLIHKKARGWIKFVIDKNKFVYQPYNRKVVLSECILYVMFEMGEVNLQMQMDEFISFRKFCLDANNYFTRHLK